MPAHVVVRDFPETLAVFRDRGVDLRRDGASPVTELAVAGSEGREPLVEALLAAISWRGAF